MNFLLILLGLLGSLGMAAAGGGAAAGGDSAAGGSSDDDGDTPPLPPEEEEEEDDTPPDTPDEEEEEEDDTPTPPAPDDDGDTPTQPPVDEDDDDTPTTPPEPGDVTPPDQSGDGGSGADDSPPPDIVEDGLEVISARVTTLSPAGDDIASVRILDGPEHGNVTVNPDNTLALVLTGTDHVGPLSFRYEITHGDGSVETAEANLDVVPGTITGGWGDGDFFMLEEDENGDLVIEHGDNHRDVYVSGSDTALTRADIARIEGIDVDKIWGSWLVDHPEYGSTPDTALAPDAAFELWRTMAKESYSEPASHWLHLEAGYEYNLKVITEAGLTGESELHPIYITSYGEGERPVITSTLGSHAEGIKNVVLDGLKLEGGFSGTNGTNVMLHDIVATTEGLSAQNFKAFTLKDSQIYDVHHEEPASDTDWGSHKSGIFIGNTTDILIENTLFDHNGWADGYAYDGSTDAAMPPTVFNHNVYIQTDNLNVTVRDNVIMKGSSFGLQLRSGGVIEGNVFLDNNGQVYVAGGNHDDGNFKGNYSLYLDNVTTSGAHKLFANNGRLTLGVGDYAPLTTHVDNIIAHLANPDDPDEIAFKTQGDPAILGGDNAYYNDTIIYNWTGSETNDPKNLGDQNTDGLDISVLDETTIQRFTALLLGKETATIDDLSDYLRAHGQELFDGKTDAEMIVEFFQAGFGLTPDIRTEAEIVRFVPNDLADGIRWDNELNWSTGDLPGSIAGDSVDLAGNWVNFGGGTQEIKNLDMGDGGRLTVGQSKLTVTGKIMTDGSDSQLVIEKAGQLWLDDYDDKNALHVDVLGGRFANTGDIDGKMRLDVEGGQTILATDGGHFDVAEGGRLSISGDDAKVGFDDDDGDTAVLRFDEGAKLMFDGGDDGRLGTIGEFRSGANGEADTNVASGVNLGQARLELDLNGVEAGDYTLIEVDQMIGTFGEIDVTGLGDRDATLTFDYKTDTLKLALGASGSGKVSIDIKGEDQDELGKDALWAALTEGHAPLDDDHIPDELRVDDELQDVA